MESILDFSNFRRAPLLDAQAQSALIRPNHKLDHALSNSATAGLPPISVLPMAGQHLCVLTQALGAKSVLEIGALAGYSSICFAQAGAKVTSIEINAKHRNVAVENVEGLDVEVILGAAEEILPSMVAEGRRFDLVFIDAELDGQWEVFDWAVKVTRKGGCILLDDVVVSMFKDGVVGEGKESILNKIGRDERVKAVLVPTVVCHSMSPDPVFNGFVMAVVLG